MLPNALPTPGPELHVPVLPGEVRELLAVRPGDTVVDCTFGGGGHAALLAEDLHGRGHFVAIDRDPDAAPHLEAFAHALPAGVELSVLRNSFARALEELAERGFRADAILFDLGVSSMQLDQPERGFSYANDAPLDMRMDPHAEPSAADLVNEWSEADLARTFTRYGEERFARPIARAIVRRRAERPFLRTLDLVDTVRGAIPTPARFGQGHPAKRVFQALRIAVNDELTELEDGPRGRDRGLRGRRPDRRDLVPLARGPHRQASLPRGRARLHLPARPAGLRLRPAAGVPRRQRPRDPPDRGRARAQPARRLGPPARRPARGRAVSASTPAPRRRRQARPAPAHQPRRRATRRIAPTAAALLALCAVLLVGVVFVQIAVIRQNMDRSDLENRAGAVSAQNRDLETQIQQAQSSPDGRAPRRAGSAWSRRRPRSRIR